MSRTYRRNKKHLIRLCVGTREENLREPWVPMYRYPTLDFERAYERQKARFTRDHHSGKFGVPRWYRRQLGTKMLRLRETHRLLRCMRDDSWESHAAESRCRNAKWYWY